MDLPQDIEARFKLATETNKILGAIVCASNADSSFTYSSAIGERTLLSGEKKPQQLDDVLCLGMGGSLITAIAALQCVEAGHLSLTGDLSTIAPELASKRVLTGFTKPDKDSGEKPVPLLESASKPITLEMLLTHSSGLVYDFLSDSVGRWCREFNPKGKADPDQRLTVEETYDYPLAFQPGSDWMVGPGYNWAGRIIDRVTGQILGDYVQEHIFTPLGISGAQFYPVTRKDLQSRQVDRNPDDPDGYGSAVLGGGGAANKASKGHFAESGLFMTAPDFTKVLRSILANDGKLLRHATVEDMFKDHLAPAAEEGLGRILVGSMGPLFAAYPAAKETKSSHGLGGIVTKEDVDVFCAEGTLTWGAAMSVVWFIDRKTDLCGFASFQASVAPGGNRFVPGLKDVFRRDIYVKHAAWKESK